MRFTWGKVLKLLSRNVGISLPVKIFMIVWWFHLFITIVLRLVFGKLPPKNISKATLFTGRRAGFKMLNNELSWKKFGAFYCIIFGKRWKSWFGWLVKSVVIRSYINKLLIIILSSLSRDWLNLKRKIFLWVTIHGYFLTEKRGRK